MWSVRVGGAGRDSTFEPPSSGRTSVDYILRMAEAVSSQDNIDPSQFALGSLFAFVQRAQAESFAPLVAGESGIPPLEPLSRWAMQAVEAAGAGTEFATFRAFAGGIGFIEDGELTSFVWHDEAVAVIPIVAGTGAFEVTYQPEPSATARRRLIENGYAEALGVPRIWPHERARPALDVFGFSGTPSDGPELAQIISPVHPGSRAGYTFRVDVSSFAAGFLVVKPLWRFARSLRIRARDPFRQARVRRDLGKLSRPSPDLRDGTPIPRRRPVVLVHGLASSAAAMALSLEDLDLSPSRFEHDTYIAIDANAKELAELVQAKFAGAQGVDLICHSRGGLVARAAADLLPPAVAAGLYIHTFGTPHRGTALADFAPFGAVLSVLDMLTHPDALRSAWRLARPRNWRTPRGIEEISPDDPFINRMIRQPHQPIGALHSWAARYSPALGGGGLHSVLACAAARLLAGDHDLCVPESSSLGAGVDQGPLNRPGTHFDYFQQPQIRTYIQASCC